MHERLLRGTRRCGAVGVARLCRAGRRTPLIRLSLRGLPLRRTLCHCCFGRRCQCPGGRRMDRCRENRQLASRFRCRCRRGQTTTLLLRPGSRSLHVVERESLRTCYVATHRWRRNCHRRLGPPPSHARARCTLLQLPAVSPSPCPSSNTVHPLTPATPAVPLPSTWLDSLHTVARTRG